VSNIAAPENRVKFGLLLVGMGVVVLAVIVWMASAWTWWFLLAAVITVPNFYAGTRNLLAAGEG
jgi:hypothetical protein